MGFVEKSRRTAEARARRKLRNRRILATTAAIAFLIVSALTVVLVVPALKAKRAPTMAATARAPFHQLRS